MRKLVFLLWMLSLFFAYMAARDECETAYLNGYTLGLFSKYSTLAFRESTEDEFKKTGFHFVYVGVGNEEFPEEHKEFLEMMTARGKKYWWAGRPKREKAVLSIIFNR